MLPYGLTLDHISDSVRATENYFNSISVAPGAPHILDLMPKSAISSLVSDAIIYYLEINCHQLIKNELASGYPDLLPKSGYPNYAISNGALGIEVKASTRKSAWDAHNPSAGWVLTVAYISAGTQVVITEVCIALLSVDDWNNSPRKSGSRRTHTARINANGVAKLRLGKVYSL